MVSQPPNPPQGASASEAPVIALKDFPTFKKDVGWIGVLIKKVQYLAYQPIKSYQIPSNPINIFILPLILQFESTFPNIQVCFA